MRETGSNRPSAHRWLGRRPRRRPDHRPNRLPVSVRSPGAPIRAILALFLVGALPPLAAAPASAANSPPQPPIWTDVPTRIEHQNDHRERIETDTGADERMILIADRPIRIRPDGSFSADGLQVRIYGIELPPRDRVCELPSGGRWACGVRANAFFISRLAGRPLTCRRRSAAGADVMLADCSVGDKDLARLMVGEGWAAADALANAELKAIEAAARAKGLGLWRQTLPDF
ncbi:MAG: thermonuclease family protein [Ancalomicrobiaceae bacterium]|nr:thermonuclease family protein [Ancalomicrobiaceae bacterium]